VSSSSLRESTDFTVLYGERQMVTYLLQQAEPLGMGENNPDETDAEENTETLDITAHIDAQTWFCAVDDDLIMDDYIVQIEEEFAKADEDRRVISELVPESKREEPAPVVGTVEHAEGELIDITLDLSDWYDE